MKLRIRDSNAGINGDTTEHEMPSGGLDIIAESGHSLFSISLEGCEIRVSAYNALRHEGVVFGPSLAVKPQCYNVVNICRIPE